MHMLKSITVHSRRINFRGLNVINFLVSCSVEIPLQQVLAEKVTESK